MKKIILGSMVVVCFAVILTGSESGSIIRKLRQDQGLVDLCTCDWTTTLADENARPIEQVLSRFLTVIHESQKFTEQDRDNICPRLARKQDKLEKRQALAQDIVGRVLSKYTERDEY